MQDLNYPVGLPAGDQISSGVATGLVSFVLGRKHLSLVSAPELSQLPVNCIAGPILPTVGDHPLYVRNRDVFVKLQTV